jgi:hypothetical protein
VFYFINGPYNQNVILHSTFVKSTCNFDPNLLDIYNKYATVVIYH